MLSSQTQKMMIAMVVLLIPTVVVTHDTIGSLRTISQAVFPMAAAIDGSPPVYYRRNATAGRSTSKWVLYMDGGDFCGYGNSEAEQLEDCYKRSKSDLGSSVSYFRKPHLELAQMSPLFDNSTEDNPLAHDWNWVYIPYLDGGYYAGMRQDTPEVHGSLLHFRGAYNIEAIIYSLAHDTNIKDATDVVLTGCSSGGVAIIASADHLHKLLTKAAPTARISTFIDSGYYMNVNTEYWTKPVMKMQQIGKTLSPACLEARRDTPWDCIVAEVAAPFVKQNSMFVWESRYDTNQLDCASIDPKNTTAVNMYGHRLFTSVKHWATSQQDALHTSHRGAYVDGCSRHCFVPGIYTPGGISPMSAFASFHDRATVKESVVVQPGAYPCASCCEGEKLPTMVV